MTSNISGIDPIVDQLIPGDLITIKTKCGILTYFKAFVVDHFGIYIGDGKVVHNKPGKTGWWMMSGADGGVTMSDIADFKRLGNKNESIRIIDTRELAIINCNEFIACPFSDDEIVSFAISQVGKKQFHFKNYNSEHFVSDCFFGKSMSNQLRNAYFKKVLHHLPIICQHLC